MGEGEPHRLVGGATVAGHQCYVEPGYRIPGQIVV